MAQIGEAEYHERAQRVRAALAREDVDAVIAYSNAKLQANVRYLTSYYVRFAGYEHTPHGYYVFGHCACLLPRDGEPVVRTDQTWDVARLETISIYPDAGGSTELGRELGRLIKARGLRRVAIDNWYVFPARDYLALREEAPECELVPSVLISDVRRVKSPAEIELIREAERICDATVQAGMDAVRPGATEYEVGLIAEATLRELGDLETGGGSIISAGANSALGSALPVREKTIERDEWVLFDVLSRYEGYCGDIARMRFAGDESDLTPELRHLHAVTVAMNRAVVSAVRPGVTPAELNRIATAVAADAGLADLKIPLVGHATGLDIHDIPDYNHDERELLVGEVFTVEPCLLRAGVAGTRIEDVVLVTEDGCEVLTSTPRGLFGDPSPRPALESAARA